MTRMSREFSLVLLGAGVLTAGWFAAPSHEDELQAKEEEQAAARVGADHTHYRRHGISPLLFVHSMTYAGAPTGARSAAAAHVTRGGFGSTGHAVGATAS